MGRLLMGVMAALAAGAISCTAFEPEVGDRLDACVDADSNPSAPVDFKGQIRPILNSRCLGCHSYEKGSKEGYNAVHFAVDELDDLRKGGTNSGANIVVAGKPCSSVLVQKLRGTSPIGARMPKSGPPYLPPEQIQLFMDWIAEGAKGDDND